MKPNSLRLPKPHTQRAREQELHLVLATSEPRPAASVPENGRSRGSGEHLLGHSDLRGARANVPHNHRRRPHGRTGRRVTAAVAGCDRRPRQRPGTRRDTALPASSVLRVSRRCSHTQTDAHFSRQMENKCSCNCSFLLQAFVWDF